MGARRSIWHRAPGPLLLAAVAAYVLAVALLFFGLRWRGQLVYDLSGVVNVEEPSPAHDAGMATGDRIVAVLGQPISHFDEIRPALAGSTSKEVTVEVERGEEHLSLVLHREGRRKLGVRPPVVQQDLPFGATLERCVSEPYDIWWRAWKRREVTIEMAPDAHAAVTFAEFLRPRGPADGVVSAGMVSSYLIPFPALLGFVLVLARRRLALTPGPRDIPGPAGSRRRE